MAQVGTVAIGRNEGERLRRCLESLRAIAGPMVYVDSGSTDGSVELARSLGADVVELDLTIPFTAARARNAGAQRLLATYSTTEFIQFVDGDCEVVSSWLPTALASIEQHPDIVVVCGRRRERFPDASIYNRLCDLEWDTPIGEALACGGDALFRVSAWQAVGGYRDDLIAGEEPELCVRLRERGGQIWRLDSEMTLHDAAMMRFGQWWKRHVRAGHAFAEVARLHRSSPCAIWQREVRSNWFWGLVVFLLGLLTAGVAWFGYGLLWWKIRRSRLRRGDSPAIARVYARYCVLSKFPQMWGQWAFTRNRLGRRRTQLIEYKGPTTA